MRSSASASSAIGRPNQFRNSTACALSGFARCRQLVQQFASVEVGERRNFRGVVIRLQVAPAHQLVEGRQRLFLGSNQAALEQRRINLRRPKVKAELGLGRSEHLDHAAIELASVRDQIAEGDEVVVVEGARAAVAAIHIRREFAHPLLLIRCPAALVAMEQCSEPLGPRLFY